MGKAGVRTFAKRMVFRCDMKNVGRGSSTGNSHWEGRRYDVFFQEF